MDANETNEWIIEGADLTILPPSGADGICRVSGYLIDAQGAPSSLPIITFMAPVDKRIMGRNVIGTEKVMAQPDSNLVDLAVSRWKGMNRQKQLQIAVQSMNQTSQEFEELGIDVDDDQNEYIKAPTRKGFGPSDSKRR